MNSYEEFSEEMILRDFLAVDRTSLANERTVLSYVRTGIGLFATGAGLVHLTEESGLTYLGYVLAVLAPLVCAFGLYRFIKVKKILKRFKAKQKSRLEEND